MSLSHFQIQDLFTFTRKHFVEWYDLQCELVDHLANDIEKMQTENPKLSFEDARDRSFKKFGVFGFMDVVEDKQKALGKRYFKMVWQEYKTYFIIPKIMLTLGLMILMVLLLRFFQYNPFFVYFSLLVPFVFVMVKSILFRQNIKKRQYETGRKWLFEDFSFNGMVGFNMMNIINLSFNLFNISFKHVAWTLQAELSFSIISILLIVFVYVSSDVLPKRFVERLSKEHPEYQLS